jgi:hypothetical protein
MSQILQLSAPTSIDDSLQKIVRRIVDFAHPEKIILFGSAARGDVKPDEEFFMLPEHRLPDNSWVEEKLTFR